MDARKVAQGIEDYWNTLVTDLPADNEDFEDKSISAAGVVYPSPLQDNNAATKSFQEEDRRDHQGNKLCASWMRANGVRIVRTKVAGR